MDKENIQTFCQIQYKLTDIQKTINISKNWNIEIWCHPDNLEILSHNISHKPNDGISTTIKPIPIYTNDNLSKTTKTWKMPKEKNKFYEYTSEDTYWAKELGYGKEVEDFVFYIFEKPHFYGFNPKNPIKNSARIT